jgi:tRNA (uracil-5-)-methyltransferase
MTDYSKLSYEEQLSEKKQKLTQLLSPYFTEELSVFASPAKHYRMRAEFRMWHEGTDTFHIMFDKHTKAKYRVDQLDAASMLINEAMQELIVQVKQSPNLRTKLFQIDYLSTTTNELVVSLLYHKQLDEDWTCQASILRNTLSKLGTVNIIGRARKQKVVIGNDYAQESLSINAKTYTFKQVENSFTQPNAAINVNMIEWVIEHASDPEFDLLELYCGAGNFSIPLSGSFRQVLGTEISKTSVSAAQDNITSNNIDNLSIARLSSEEFVQAYNKEREFNRLSNIDLDSYDFQTILVDPPRAGLDDATLALVAKFNTIVYVSCNPSTLTDNLNELCKTHSVKSGALFDQFPFTEHIESGVILVRKSD